VATSSAVLAVASYAGVLAGSRNSARALAMLNAGVPKPARADREAFTAQLGTDRSAGDVLVLDVLEGHALLTGRL
jgi:cation-transporting ATPase I